MFGGEEIDSEARERTIVEALRRIIRAIDLHSRQLDEAHGLTAPQLAAMQAIHRAAPISPGELARHIHLSAGTVSGILARLESRGLVLRAPSPLDGRRVELRLSESGSQMLRRAPSLLQDRFRRSLARLADWEQHQLLASLQRIAAMMNAGDLDASPHLTIGDPSSVPSDCATPADSSTQPEIP